MEVEAQARKLLLQQIKLGWLICKTVTTWLQTDVLNVPDLTIDFASAEERKPTLCRKPQAERMYSISNGMQMHQMPDVQQTEPAQKHL
jgi:hypothetical protein